MQFNHKYVKTRHFIFCVCYHEKHTMVDAELFVVIDVANVNHVHNLACKSQHVIKTSN